MGWRQKELEEMSLKAKQRFRQNRQSSCVYCGSLIKCDMYRHVARFHLDLAQLWWCPVSWCTVWKGTPQHYMDHLRGVHDVPWEVKSASLEKYLPPWTITRQVWSDSLSAQHSGISTDVLLFSDIQLSLVHHYRIHKRGLPHIAFRRNYLSQLCELLPLPVVQPAPGVVSPDSSGSGSFHLGDSPDVVDRSPRTTRRAYRQRRPVRVMEPPVVNLPVFTIQDPLAAVGAVVLDCRPPLLPVSMDIRGVDLSAGRLPAVSAGMDVLLHGHEPMSSGGGGFAGINLSGGWCCSTSGPIGSPSSAVDESILFSTTSGVDLEVAHALLDVGVFTAMVTPIVDPAVGFSITPATYPVSPVPMLSFVDWGWLLLLVRQWGVQLGARPCCARYRLPLR